MNDPLMDAMIGLIQHNVAAVTGKSKPAVKSASGKSQKDLKRLKIDKLFEIVALSELLTELRAANNACQFTLMSQGKPGSRLTLQANPGKADLQKSFVLVSLGGAAIATIWTNVEFVGMSGPAVSNTARGTYHEADILVLDPAAHHGRAPIRPSHHHVLLAIECKYLDMLPKAVLRNMLGLRREMSLLGRALQPSALQTLLGSVAGTRIASGLPASPASHLIFCYPSHYKFEPTIDWFAPGKVFGIEFWPL